MRAAVVLSPQARPWHWVAAKVRRCWIAVVMCFLSTTTAWSVNVHTYPSLAVPVTIPANPNPPGSQMGTAQSSVVVSNIVGEILTVRVSMYISHSWPADLQIILISPDNTQVILADNVGGNNRGRFGNAGAAPTTGFGIGNAEQPLGRVEFDQAALIGVDNIAAVNPQDDPEEDTEYILSGLYRPIAGQSLNNFTGKTGNQANGTWRLVINDQAFADQGVLRSWTLEIEEATTHIWTGVTSNDWGTASNWLNNNIPNENERNATIIFPDNLAVGAFRVVNRPANGGIRVRNLQIAGGYDLTGFGFGMSDASTILTTAGTGANNGAAIDIDNDIALFGATTLTVIPGGALNLTGDISGTGSLTKNSTGTAVLSGANTYGGLTTVSGGILSVTTANGLGTGGTAASATSVANGATLQTSVTIGTEWLSLVGTGTAGQGALSLGAAAAVNWSGPITLSTQGSGVGAIAGGTLSLTNFAVTTGIRELIKVGAGTVILTAAVPATTNLTVNEGNLTATTVAQPNVGILKVNNATFTPTANVTVNNSISTTGTATLAAGNIVLNGTRNMTVSSTVNVASTFTNGTLSVRGGTVNWQSTSAGAGLVMERGTLTGAGTTANLTLNTAKMDATGAFSVANFTVGSNAWLVFRNQAINATGTVTIQDGVLQPFANGTVVNLSGANVNTGAFRFYPRTGSSVNYAGGTGNDVVFTATGAATAAFTPTTSYTVAETAGSVALTISTTGNMNLVITSAGGVLDPGGDFEDLTLTNVNGAVTPALTINDDYIEEGTESGQLIIIPVTGGFCAASPNDVATLTINDNDEDDHKPCGFGTGLTVFLLLGFGLLLNARLRRS